MTPPAMDRALASDRVADGDGAPGPPPDVADAAAAARTRERLWWAAGVLYRRRLWVAGLTAAVAAAAVAITLQIPNEYRAETRVLLPESEGGGLLAGALSNLPPAAAALVGGGGGGSFTRYMAILTSPSTLGSVVDAFDLAEVYGLADEPHPRRAAIEELAERAVFEVSLDYDYLSVAVLDRDPERSAALANYFVERLNERHVAFQAGSAAEYRAFLEARLEEADADLDSAQAELQAIQERTGVIEPGAQAEALFTSLGAAQAAASEAEVRYRALEAEYGPENPDVRSARAAAQAARQQVARLTGGAERGIPSLSGLPGVGRQYAQVRQELEIQRAIIETVRPMYEQAALQERREADAVQVLDVAEPPVRKAAPRRSVLVVAATLSGFLVVVATVLLVAVVRRAGPPALARLRAAG